MGFTDACGVGMSDVFMLNGCVLYVLICIVNFFFFFHFSYIYVPVSIVVLIIIFSY